MAQVQLVRNLQVCTPPTANMHCQAFSPPPLLHPPPPHPTHNSDTNIITSQQVAVSFFFCLFFTSLCCACLGQGQLHFALSIETIKQPIFCC